MGQTTKNISSHELRYLQLLSHDFPTVSDVTREIINLEAILHLPKPTEHFMADLHGEDEAFIHVLRNASGDIKRKVRELFGSTMTAADIRNLCTLIYYPEEKLELLKQEADDLQAFYASTLSRLIAVCRRVSSKYTRSRVRKALPEDFAYIIEELLHEQSDDRDKQEYVNIIIRTIIGTRRADHFITALCQLIQKLAIDRLHILGDIFDRGPGSHLILETLRHYHRWDIQWGNHDILWLGAAAGNAACVCSVLRLSLRYANTRTLEEGYAINMVPLATFAIEHYADDPCELFIPRLVDGGPVPTEKNARLIAQMHKAVSIMQFKLEGQLYRSHPEWGMKERALLEKIDYRRGTILLEGREYNLLDKRFPTIDPADPLRLTPEEEEVIRSLVHSFRISPTLQRHVLSLLSHGSMCAVVNGNLLFHASIPMTADGQLRRVNVCGEEVAGRELMLRVEQMVRSAFDEGLGEDDRGQGRDYFWYLWCGPDSPLFDKSKMATFERHFLAERETWHEEKGAYYQLRNAPEVCDMLLDHFGVQDNHRHIINGHVPVRAASGESPVKADGRLMVIDGGFAKAYHAATGIAGYTLVFHSRGFELVQHEPFESAQDAIRNGTDIKSTTQLVELTGHRLLVADTDKGAELRRQVQDLERLLRAYRKGIVRES